MAPKSILLVEDEEPVCRVLQHVLEAAGHTVESAADGVAASRAMERGTFNVLVTDLLMPERDGIELIREVRRRYPDVRIVAMSGGGRIGGSEYLRLAQGMGAKALLEKPFRPEAVCAAVELACAN